MRQRRASWVHTQHAVDHVYALEVRIAVDNDVEPCALQIPILQSLEACARRLEVMDNGHLKPVELQRLQRFYARVVGDVKIVVPLGRNHRRDRFKVVQNTRHEDVASVKNQINAAKSIEDLREEDGRLWDVHVR